MRAMPTYLRCPRIGQHTPLFIGEQLQRCCADMDLNPAEDAPSVSFE